MMPSVFSSNIRLGMLGGGQLGRMFIREAIRFDVDVHILDNDPDAPCSGIAASFTLGDITDYEAVYNFGKDKDVLTVEIENVCIDALYELEKEGVRVFPQPRVLEIVRDKGIQKSFYRDNGLPTAAFRLIDEPHLSDLSGEFPFVQKLRTGGYDGRGVQVIRSSSDLNKAFPQASVMEELVPFARELSVIVARNESDETVVYPAVECEFNDANLVEYLFSPAGIDQETEKRARELAERVIRALDMIGILAVEMFHTTDGKLLINEIAPRPHNSGHHTIECNETSQFEQHLRAILNLPLGSTRMIQPGAMINLIGARNYSGPVHYEGLQKLLEMEGLHPHIYGKKETRPNRKMGHITITGADIAQVKARAAQVRSIVRVISAKA